jgi:hypothetical protein
MNYFKLPTHGLYCIGLFGIFLLVCRNFNLPTMKTFFFFCRAFVIIKCTTVQKHVKNLHM